METKKDILWRSYLVYLLMLLIGVAIIGKAFVIQQVEGSYWKGLSDSLHLEYRELDAERGSIYSEDGRMLSSSIPYFDIYLDFGAEGIQEKNGERFKKNLDSVSISLAAILQTKTPAGYKRELAAVFRNQDRYHLLVKNINFNQYRELKEVSFIKKNKNKNGFIFVEKEKRMAPFGLLANRTIGLAREYMDSTGNIISKSVGLEKTYDSLLKGVTGKRLVRRISGGAFVPVEGQEIEPENGKDIITTIDINIQEVAEQSLLKVLSENECEQGTCIVMEVKTGKIKAIANLGRKVNGEYDEIKNYAVERSEPGSTFKLMTMLAVFEDQFANIHTPLNIEEGKWPLFGKTVFDSETHHRTNVTVQQAFELSSNVGMAKLAMSYYSNNPQRYINHLKRLHLTSRSGVDLLGESFPLIPDPKRRDWSRVTLPWMSFGYNIAVSPLQTLMVYNAVANNGRMMKPYLVNSILQDGNSVRNFEPIVLEDSICSPNTLKQLKICLEGVVKSGTAKSLQSLYYSFAGKTGTAKIANGNKGYDEHHYQSSFAGYFPAEAPKYSCIVVIKNKPYAAKYYGAEVAGPVFQAIADKVFTLDAELYASYRHRQFIDTTKSVWHGAKNDFARIAKSLKVQLNDSGKKGVLAAMTFGKKKMEGETTAIQHSNMPDLKGFGLKDALELLERQQLQVVAVGKGKVISQSIQAGMSIQRGQTVYLTLGASIQ